MATYVLIHGAGDSGWCWHLVAAELTARGHDAVPVDLPCDDPSAGLAEYADAVIDAIGDRAGLVVVANSLGGFTAPLVCDRVPVDLLVLVAAMVPAPGEAAEDWWTNTGYADARRATEAGDDDEVALFYNDVPGDLVAEARRHWRDQAATPGREPWPLAAWPDVPTRYLLCRRDRVFPAEWMRRVVRERLGLVPDEIDAGHCPFLSRPGGAAERLEGYRIEVGGA